jgi:hypothetical protein
MFSDGRGAVAAVQMYLPEFVWNRIRKPVRGSEVQTGRGPNCLEQTITGSCLHSDASLAINLGSR